MSVVIVSLASFASQTLRQSRTDYISLESAESLGYVVDDVTDDIATIIGTKLFATRNETHLIMHINDTSPFPKSPYPPIYLGSYQAYLQSQYYSKTNAIININSSDFEQNGIVYSFSNPNGSYSHVQAADGYDTANFTLSDDRGLNLSSAILSVYFCNQTRSGFTQMPSDLGGSIRVSIIYTDLTGTVRQNATIARGTQRTFSVDYTDINQSFTYLIDTTGSNSVAILLYAPENIGCNWNADYALQYAASNANGQFSATYSGIAANFSEKNGNYTKR